MLVSLKMKTARQLVRTVAFQSKNFSATATMSTKTVNDVQHNKEKCEFFLQIPEGERALRIQKAYLSYGWVDAGHIDMYHTEVPPVYRGQGVAKLLAKAAFDYVVKEDLKMTLSCTYLQKYFRENALPEYQGRVV